MLLVASSEVTAAWEDAVGSQEHDWRLVAQVQSAVRDAFAWAIAQGIEEEETIQEEIRGALSQDPPSQLNEFTRYSSGYSRFQQGEINYNGGGDNGEWPSDGYSIQSARRATASSGD